MELLQQGMNIEEENLLGAPSSGGDTGESHVTGESHCYSYSDCDCDHGWDTGDKHQPTTYFVAFCSIHETMMNRSMIALSKYCHTTTVAEFAAVT